MPEAGALAPRQGRLEWLGPIPAEPESLPLPGVLGRGLDLLDIMLANSLAALFAAVKR